MLARTLAFTLLVTTCIAQETVYKFEWPSNTKTPEQGRKLSEEDIDKFQQNIRMFSASMFYKIGQQSKPNENIFFSPLSIAHAMGMVNAGAKKNTSAQIKRALRQKSGDANTHINALFASVTEDKFTGDGNASKGSVVTLMASRSFFKPSYDVYPSYARILSEFYHSEAERLDFTMKIKAAARINGWVAQQTNDLIKDLVEPDLFTPLTRFVLVNALYFKAPWAALFSERASENFITPSGNVSVPFLTNEMYCKRQETEKYTFVAIPYKDLKTWFMIIMPKTKADMKEFTRRDFLTTYFKSLRRENVRMWPKEKITLFMPKFTVEKALDVKKVLKTMGVRDLFSEATADLSGISREFVYVSDFVHKARITVNKDGTEAAAASAVFGAARIFIETDEVWINRPFIYAVYEEGNILFMGKMMKPDEK